MRIHVSRLLIVSITIVLTIIMGSCNSNSVNENKFIYAKNGRLYFPDGNELALWGVNLQPCLSWEYNSLFKLVGVPLNADTLKKATDEALDEIQKMNCDLIRCHLTPTDFTDDQGNLVETIYLDLLDYMIAEAAKRGMYSYITFLNPSMSYDIDVEDPKANVPSFVENSFLKGTDRKQLITDQELKAKSKNFIQQLLNRENPYLGRSYKNSPSIAVWEIINEPLYYSYDEIKASEYFPAYAEWLTENGVTDKENNYKDYSYALVLNYINEMYDAIRETGAVQPIVWNCNWNRMIINNEEVFDAIAASKVEVVSFCNYPGQGIPKKPYTKNPIDLSRYDFSSFLKDSYEQEDWYRWALRPDFMKKAKVVYEFEIFYNQSGYLYPAQADFFRAMGVQMASMWHYSMSRYAPYRNGSHHLSLTSTPKKAAAYAIAGEVFRSQPLYHEYNTESTTEKVSENFMYSYEKNLSIFSSEQMYSYSGNVSPGDFPQPVKGVDHILGLGSSPVVSYDGTGIYSVHISDNSISIELEPNTEQLKPLWGKDFLVSLVTKLDYSTAHNFTLNIDAWDVDQCDLFRIVGEDKIKAEFAGNGKFSFDAVPGRYEVSRTSD